MTCPRHPGARLITATFAGASVPVLACPECDHWERLVRGQRKLPGLDRGRQSKRVHIPEDEAQEAVVDALRLDGYTVLVTSRKKAKVCCTSCGTWQWPMTWSRRQQEYVPAREGGDRGIPDLLVTHVQKWPIGIWLGIECKGTDTDVSTEQQELESGGCIIVLRAQHSIDWTVAEARRIVGSYHHCFESRSKTLRATETGEKPSHV